MRKKFLENFDTNTEMIECYENFKEAIKGNVNTDTKYENFTIKGYL